MSADGDGPDWLGLLKWSLAQTDGSDDSDARPMVDEDVQFLTNVMESLVADEPKRMREMMVGTAVQKIITFALNSMLVRRTHPGIFGVAAVQLELWLSTLLFSSSWTASARSCAGPQRGRR